MGPDVYFIHSAALPSVYLSPCMYMSPGLYSMYACMCEYYICMYACMYVCMSCKNTFGVKKVQPSKYLEVNA